MKTGSKYLLALASGGTPPPAGFSAAYWQGNAPADAPGSANTPSMLWSGAVGTTSFVCSAKFSASATNIRLVVSTDATMATGLAYYKTSVPTTGSYAKLSVLGLPAGTTLYYGFLVDGVLKVATIGKFKTLTSGNVQTLKIGFGSCSDNSNSTGFDTALGKGLDFFLFMGDKHYQDVNTTTASDYATAYDTIFSNANIATFYRSVAIFDVWDDHDFCGDNSYSGSTGVATAQAAYRSRVPHGTLEVSDGIYRTFDVGRLKFVILDCRSFRSVNSATDDSNKTMLGSTQKTWFKNLLTDSANAGKFFIVISSVGWRTTSGDEWATYNTERTELSTYITSNSLNDRILMLSGDMHAVAADGGSRNTLGGFPTFHAAPLSQTNSDKGGTYDFGVYQDSNRQFGLLDITDDGTTLTVRFRGYTGADVLCGAATIPMDYTFTALDTVSYETETTDLVARFSTAVVPTRKREINDFIKARKDAGTFSKKDASWLLAAANANAAQRNLIADQYNLTEVTSPGFSADRGYTGSAGGARLDTGFNPTTAVSPQYAQDSAHLEVWVLTDVQSGYEIAQKNAVGNVGRMSVRNSSGNTPRARLNDGSSSNFGSVGTAAGHWVITRTASGDRSVYHNGVLVATVAGTSGALVNSEFALLTDSATHSTNQLALGGLGSGLTGQNIADDYASAHTYLQKVGAVA